MDPVVVKAKSNPRLVGILLLVVVLSYFDLSGYFATPAEDEDHSALGHSYFLQLLFNEPVSGLYIATMAFTLWRLYENRSSDRNGLAISIGLVYGGILTSGCGVLVSYAPSMVGVDASWLTTISYVTCVALFCGFHGALLLGTGPRLLFTAAHSAYYGNLPVPLTSISSSGSSSSSSSSGNNTTSGIVRSSSKQPHERKLDSHSSHSLRGRRNSIDTRSRVTELEMQLQQARTSLVTSESLLAQAQQSHQAALQSLRSRHDEAEKTSRTQLDRFKGLLEQRTAQLEVLSTQQQQHDSVQAAQAEEFKQQQMQRDAEHVKQMKALEALQEQTASELAVVEAAASAVPRLEAQLSSLTADKDELSKKLMENEAVTNDHMTQLGEAKRHVSELTSAVKASEKRYEQLKAAVAEKTAKWESQENAQKKFELNTAKQTKLSAQVKTLENKLRTVEKKLQKANASVSKSSNETKTARDEIKQVKLDLETANVTHQEEKTQLEATLASYRAEEQARAEKNQARHEQKIEEYVGMIEDLEKKRLDAVRELETSTENSASNNTRVTELEAQVVQLQQAVSVAEQKQAEMAKQMVTRDKAVRSQQAEGEATSRALQQKDDELRKTSDKARALEAKNEELVTTMNTLQQQIVSMKAREAALISREEAAGVTDEENAQLLVLVSDTQGKLKQMNVVAARAQKEVAQLKSQVSTLESKLVTAQDAEGETQQLRVQISTLEAKLAHAQDAATCATEAVVPAVTSTSNDEEVERLAAQVAVLEEKLVAAQDADGDSSDKLEQLSQANALLVQAVEQEREAKASVETALKAMKESDEKKRMKFVSLVNMAKQQKTALAELERDNKALREHASALKARLRATPVSSPQE